MMRDFHMAEERAVDELALAKGFSLLAWNMEANPWVAVERVSDGYVAQEALKNS